MKSGSPEPKRPLTSDSPNGAGETPSSRSGHGIEAELDTLKQRLAGAESALRTTRRIGSAAIGAMMVGTAVALTLVTTYPGQAKGERTTLRAPFRVVDAQGKPLLRLDADRNGTQLRLFDSAGEPISVLGATPEGGIFRVSSRGGRGNLQLYADAHGGQLTLSGQNQARPVAWLGSKEEGGGLAIYDVAGSPAAWVTTSKDRRGLSIGDPSGRPVAWLGAAQEGGVAVYNRSGQTAAYLTVSRGSGSLAVYDSTRKKSSTLTADTDLSGRMMFGPSVTAGVPASPVAGAKLAQAAMRPPLSVDPGWLLHRSAASAVAQKLHPVAHPASAAPPLPGAAHSAQAGLTPPAASHRPKPAARLTAIGPESEAGPQGATSRMPQPPRVVTARSPEEAPAAEGANETGKAPSVQDPALEGARSSSGVSDGSARPDQKLALAAQPDAPATPAQAGQDSARKTPQAHPAGAATTSGRTRHRRHGRRHHTRRVHRHSRRHRRWLRLRHRRHHAHRSSRRLARKALRPRSGEAAHRPTQRTGTPLHPQRLGAGSAHRVSLPTAATRPKGARAVPQAVDPD